MSTLDDDASVLEIAAAVASRRASARAVVAAALDRIGKRDAALNCFTAVLGERALADAERIDRAIGGGGEAGPLAGVPFAVKNLFDIHGVTTLAGSRIYRENPPAERDAAAVAALRRAGATTSGVALSISIRERATAFAPAPCCPRHTISTRSASAPGSGNACVRS
ncbi:MAG TPA: amidase family protein, partial [Candidatus Binatia bacterium]|nr:amidase family protein [Candidatus Binatia bacterium]